MLSGVDKMNDPDSWYIVELLGGRCCHGPGVIIYYPESISVNRAVSIANEIKFLKGW